MFKKLYTGSALLICATAFAQVGINTDTPAATFDVVGKPTVTSALDGIIAPRIDGAQLRAKAYTAAQTGALVYVTAADTAPAGQTVNVTSTGYYYFDGTVWVKPAGSGGSGTDLDGVVGNEVLDATTNGGLVRAGGGTASNPYTLGLTSGTTSGQVMTWNGTAWSPAAVPSVNIYNANGTLTSPRTLTQNGNSLTFLGNNQQTQFDVNNGINQTGIAGIKRASLTLTASDNNNNGTASSLQVFQDPEAVGQITGSADSRGLNIGPTATTQAAPLTFMTSAGSSANGTEKMRITPTGNVGVATIAPTETFHVNGITRLQGLPQNGATNAIYTTSGGTASATQNQTFTATRTVVADANGVLGYVTGVPTGSTRVVVSASAQGNQNIGNVNLVPANYPNESIDTFNAYASNVFTVPTGMSGLYSFSMQSAHFHDVNAQTSWFVSAVLEKSTDGGSTYAQVMKDTSANLAGSIVDNGNAINWTGSLNAGDKLRLLYQSDSSASNYVRLGSITITHIVQ